MIEEEHIDDLFRSTLLHQEFPVDEHARNEAMKILDERKRKNVRVIYWISGLLGLLAIGVGLAFFYSDEEKNSLEQRIETPANDVLPEKSPQSLADSAIQSSRSADTSNGSNSTGSNETISADNSVRNKNSTNVDLEIVEPGKMTANSKVRIGNMKTSSANETLSAKEEMSPARTSNISGSNAPIPNVAITVNPDLENAQGVLAGGTTPDAISTSPASPAGGVETNESAGTDTEIAEAITSAGTLNPEIHAEHQTLDSLSLEANFEDSLTESHTDLKPDFNRKAFSKWDVRLAGSGLYTFSTIGQRNLYADVYAQQRNQQETSMSGYGVDVSLSRTNERSFMSLGLGYAQTRENIQYDAKKIEQAITSQEFWEYETTLYMIVDGTGTNQNNILWDTSFMELMVDSSLFVTYDTTTTTTENTAITAFNGIAKWSHLYLPLVYGIRLDHKTKSSLYAVGSLEFDYLAGSTAHYLTSDGQSVKAMTEFPGYRRFMINGSVGVEWRKLLGGERMYLLVNPGIRTNLYSWNADFRHTMLSPYLRAGIGVRLFER